MSKDFFSNKEHANYYETIQKLINIIINLRDIELYLKEEILHSEK